MEVDIEDGNALRALITQVLCRDGGIIQETVATIHIERGVVPGRATEGKYTALSLQQRFCPSERHVLRRQCCQPSTLGDRCFRRQGIVADLAVNKSGYPRLHTSGQTYAVAGTPIY